MSRAARVKSNVAMYHVMSHSISEIELFREDEDKDIYLDLLKAYCCRNHCSVLAYCLMDNHIHLHFDPQGYDLSKFMQGVNLTYVQYYNKKYNRQGHLFQGRFKSKIIASDHYARIVSAYIHNNAKDVQGYNGREHEYPYSSLGIYLGIREDTRNLVSTDYTLRLFDGDDRQKALEAYITFIEGQKKDLKEGEGIGVCLTRLAMNEYRSERHIIIREIKPERVVEIVTNSLGMLKECIHMKSVKAFDGCRAYTAFILRSLGGLTYREICSVFGNISLGGVANLCRRGYELLRNGGVYKRIFDSLISLSPAA